MGREKGAVGSERSEAMATASVTVRRDRISTSDGHGGAAPLRPLLALVPVLLLMLLLLLLRVLRRRAATVTARTKASASQQYTASSQACAGASRAWAGAGSRGVQTLPARWLGGVGCPEPPLAALVP